MPMSSRALDWRDIVDLIEKCLRPAQFHEEIAALFEQGYSEEEALGFFGGLVGHYLVEGAGLVAALTSPPEIARRDLAGLSARLGSLEFGSGLEHLPWREQMLYHRFVGEVRPLFADLGRAIAAVLTAYVADSYNLASDPNALLVEADGKARESLEWAKELVARAGALGLRGKRFWWGWPREIERPLRRWTALVAGFVDSVTQEGHWVFQEADLERERWVKECRSLKGVIAALEREHVSLAEIQFAQPSETVNTEVEDLIYTLFDGEEALAEESLFAFKRHQAAIVPYLIGLAQDQSLWQQEAQGKGWTPIRAVKVLGRLGAPEAVESLLQILTVTEEEDRLRDQILLTLKEIGQPALPALLDILSYSRDRGLKLSLSPLLGAIGRGSDAAYRALTSLCEETEGERDAALALLGLAALQDERSAPRLESALRDSRLSPIDKEEIREALDQLATETHRKKVAWRTE